MVASHYCLWLVPAGVWHTVLTECYTRHLILVYHMLSANVVFLMMQYEKMHAVISLAGGSAIVAEEIGVTGVNDRLLIDNCTCVMRCDVAATQSSQAAHSWIKYVHQLLTR